MDYLALTIMVGVGTFHFVELIKFFNHDTNHVQWLLINVLSKHIYLKKMFQVQPIPVRHWPTSINMNFCMVEVFGEFYKSNNSDHFSRFEMSPQNPKWMGLKCWETRLDLNLHNMDSSRRETYLRSRCKATLYRVERSQLSVLTINGPDLKKTIR